MAFMPLDRRQEMEHPRACVEVYRLAQRGVTELALKRHAAPQAALGVDVFNVRQFRPGDPVVGIQIPRVPLSGVVVMQLEDVSRSSQDFAAGLLVPDRCEHRAVVPLHAQQLVLDCVIRYGHLGFGSEWMRRHDGPSAGRSDDAHVGRPDPRQLPPPVRGWVEHRRA